MEDYALTVPEEAFADSRAAFASVLSMLSNPVTGAQTHAELEEQLAVQGRELLRVLFQDHLHLRAVREQRLDAVVGADAVVRHSAEPGHCRALLTVFGEVEVERIAYRAKGADNLHPADLRLNLPAEKHSHGLRWLAAIEAARGSFADAGDALARGCGTRVGKRQLEALAFRSSVDIDDFYERRRPGPRDEEDLVVMSVDGKGIVMLPDSLLEKTRQNAAVKAAAGGQRLATRLSSGEKLGRKRMAEVGAVYDATPVPRLVCDVIAHTLEDRAERTAGPVATGKWLTASVEDTCAQVIAAVFAEAERRDPEHRRTWLMLGDGSKYQLDLIHAEAKRRKVTVHIVCDFVHVLEYLWKAAWCFHPHGDPAAERWVAGQARKILQGQAGTVAAAIRRKATYAQLSEQRRKGADTCAGYLTAKKPYLRYGKALAAGGLADRHRHHRGRLPPPGQGPHGHHRRPLEPIHRPSDARDRSSKSGQSALTECHCASYRPGGLCRTPGGRHIAAGQRQSE